ncbi:hypothetical protein MDAP_002757 [Mitosporidium daphniae]|uniref:LPD-2 protein n=1 Tax=Mitosporidium daphniae TaxID=1485682 RepID=A0A098VT66_9MICR|nr:LPD-2 protein [Mitosporidium daphniae]KGG52192.1 LPD-2 protein [Mitosporidium daphniae]|eukprot:XP_013238619.1 LPD-2 protein [Mitosporidium daphniae]
MLGSLSINSLFLGDQKNGEQTPLDPELSAQLEEILSHMQKAHQRLLEHPESNELGLSLYSCKHQVFSEYILNILFSVLANATSSNNAALEEEVSKALFKNRLFIDKSKPIEAKMRFQIERLLEQSSNSSLSSSSNNEVLLSHKPNLSSILEDKGSESSSLSDAEDGERAYKAPKIAPAFFHSSNADLEKKKQETRKLTAKSRRLVNEFKDEFSSRPEEVSYSVYRNSEFGDKEHSITQFEEDNFTRVEKKKKKSKRSSAPELIDALDELDSIGLLDKYTPDSEDEAGLFHPKKKKGRRNYLPKLSKKDLDEEIASDDDYALPKPKSRNKRAN